MSSIMKGALVLLVLFISLIHVLAHTHHHTTTTLTPHTIRISHVLVDTHDDIVIDTKQPSFSWQTTTPQHAYRIRVYDNKHHVKHGHCPSDKHTPLHDTGFVTSSHTLDITHDDMSLQAAHSYIASIQYMTGKDTSQVVCVTFRTSLLDEWRKGELAGDWEWIGSTHVPINQLRREFSITKSVTSAYIYMSGIGYSTLYLNGQPVDASRINDPGWTTYEKRTLYVSYDVTKSLSTGANVIAVELGNGWYSQEQYQSGVTENQYGPPRLLFSLTISFTDGTLSTIVSDSSWLGRYGPIIHDGIYMGTLYDARLERPGWNNISFNDPYSLWVNASIVDSPLQTNGVLSLQIMDPIRVAPYNLHTSKIDATKTAPNAEPHTLLGVPITQGVIVPTKIDAVQFTSTYDLGQNIAGWCRIVTPGRPGNMLSIRHSEIVAPYTRLDHNALYTDNLRSAAATDVHIFKSYDDEIVEPKFTQHGFRYINLRGQTSPITSIECMTVHSETTLVGHFTTSNAIINQIQHNIQWGQIANLMSLPTDCPQRDERKGWMGDASLTVDESLYNYDLHLFWLNYLNLIHDVQDKQGCVGDTTPFTWGQWPADNNWGTAYPQIAWYLYDHYGDIQVLATHISGVRAWIECVRAAYDQTGLKNLRHHYGDWVPPPPYQQSNGALIASFPFLRDIQTLIRMAKILNLPDIVTEYSTLYATLAKEYHTVFWSQNSTIGYADGMQTANVLSLTLPNVVPTQYVSDVVQALVYDIQTKNQITTGIVGTANLFPVLSDNDQHDLALQLLQQTKYPSYGYMFNNPTENATTLWELWDTDNPSEGPQMDSRNHIMFGAVGAYFYRYLAGISLSGLGMSSALTPSHPLIPTSSVTIHPRMSYNASLMSSLHTQHDTYHGLIVVEYERQDENIDMHVTTPTTTTLVLARTIRNATCAQIMLHTTTGIVTLYDETHVWEESSCHDMTCISRSRVTSVPGVSWIWMTTSMTERDIIKHMSLHVAAGSYHMDVKWM